jgi:membrane-associated phospholipid phosphatase
MTTSAWFFSGIRRHPILLLLAAAAVAGAFACDAAVVEWIREAIPKATRAGVGSFISKTFDWLGQMILCGLVWVGGWARGSARVRRLALAMMLGSTVGGLAVNVLRLSVGRTRPNAKGVEQGWYGPVYEGKPTAFDRRFHGFPSAHVGTSAGMAAVAGFALGARGGAVWLFPFFVGFGRMLVGAHRVSDVVCAFLIAALAARWIWSVKWRSLARDWQLPPPGGGSPG